eukprot:scaffold56662_cov43-Attheya_sp.AAC.2
MEQTIESEPQPAQAEAAHINGVWFRSSPDAKKVHDWTVETCSGQMRERTRTENAEGNASSFSHRYGMYVEMHG